jgi:hypothetical protein
MIFLSDHKGKQIIRDTILFLRAKSNANSSACSHDLKEIKLTLTIQVCFLRDFRTLFIGGQDSLPHCDFNSAVAGFVIDFNKSAQRCVNNSLFRCRDNSLLMAVLYNGESVSRKANLLLRKTRIYAWFGLGDDAPTGASKNKNKMAWLTVLEFVLNVGLGQAVREVR